MTGVQTCALPICFPVTIYGRILTPEIVLEFEKEELENIKKYVGENRFEKGKFDLATKLFNELVFDENFEDFLTLKAYPFI